MRVGEGGGSGGREEDEIGAGVGRVGQRCKGC